MDRGQSDSKIAAFFDFDNTLIHGDSQAMEAEFFIKEKKAPPFYLLKIARVLLADFFYKKHLISPWRFNRFHIKTYRGFNIKRLEQTAFRLYESVIKPAYFKGMLDTLAHHRDCGHMIVIVSATANHLLEPVRQDISPDLIIGTPLETRPDGICTGKPDGHICIGKKKKSVILDIASTYGIDLKSSYAYSDHHADIPFIEAVGNPVVVNPTPKLKQLADKRGWKVIMFPLD